MPINPSGVKQQTFYSHAIPKRGTPVFLTGQVAWDAEGHVVGAGDIDAQVAQVYRNLGMVLADLGATPADIVKTVTYVTDRAFIPAIHKGRHAFFGTATLPASTLVVVAGLADPALMLEIEAVLMLPEDQPAFRR
ncbi:RidA family protein [Segnochrobactrum spirostomi]|uniref:RidA family protein n=1 Tax=Segnochrobactrum spirostomi TaxID=2608987 RepID=A0A6A7Y818_9HYPH|nr:RidA family protein [Segnochrobactrum spirostomi]MQT15484.1 RidA family protein [Segnochrobactrum spirostomi]